MLVAVLASCGLVAQALAQTPWAASPASPAPLPGQSSSTGVQSLAPPPQRFASPAGVSTPAFVPVPQTPGPQAIGNFGAAQPERGLPAYRTEYANRSSQPPPLPSMPILSGNNGLPPSGRAAFTQVAVAPPSGGTTQGQLVAYANRDASNIEPEQLQSGELLAVVGGEHILAGDMSVFVEPIIEQNRDRIDSKETEDKLRLQLTRQVLKQYVTIKAMYQEFFRDMLGNASPKEFADTKRQVVTKAGKIFFEKQVPNLLERYEVNDIAALEQKLAEKSMSLNTLRRQFIEQVLSGELENKYVPREFEIDRRELLTAYQSKAGEWDVPARARWRQITIRLDRHDRVAAAALIKNLYEQIYLGGKPFEAVAKQASEGYAAEQGGVYEWTTQGSLKSEVLDNAIFTYPLRELSPIIEDDIGFHIVEVLEREARFTKEFSAAQPEIRKQLSEEKRNKARDELRTKVMARTPVWSRWPEDLKAEIPDVRPLSDALGVPGK